MPIDLSNVPPEQLGQATMFATMLASMPTEGLQILSGLIAEELASRGD